LCPIPKLRPPYAKVTRSVNLFLDICFTTDCIQGALDSRIVVRCGRQMLHWPHEDVDVTAKFPSKLGGDRAGARRLRFGRLRFSEGLRTA
jgi:hypothetical protein